MNKVIYYVMVVVLVSRSKEYVLFLIQISMFCKMFFSEFWPAKNSLQWENSIFQHKFLILKVFLREYLPAYYIIKGSLNDLWY